MGKFLPQTLTLKNALEHGRDRKLNLANPKKHLHRHRHHPPQFETNDIDKYIS